MKLTPHKLREMIREEILREDIGWDNLPDGWDEDSVDSFAQNLTGQEGEEGFFSACMDKVEDKFDDPEAFCASLKDEYLGTTDWRGKDESKNQSNKMKLTETKLRQLIREELLQEFDVVPATSIPEVERFVDTYIGNVDAGDVEAVDAVGNRYAIILPKNAMFSLNMQGWPSRLKDNLVGIDNLGGRVQITMEL